jgi:outer membrane protein assembly factor BamE (lipoprotein component of BamABCDE complex)
MQKKGWAVIMSLGMAFYLSACAQNGQSKAFLDQNRTTQIRIGQSDKSHVKAILGEPQRITTHAGGTETWVYTHSKTSYTEKYAAKTALSFVPIPYLGTAVGLADKVVDAGPDKTKETRNLSLKFNTKGILVESTRETLHD